MCLGKVEGHQDAGWWTLEFHPFLKATQMHFIASVNWNNKDGSTRVF
jgi:hypothetical protein